MSANVSTIKLSDGREICLSYGVPVAAFIPVDYTIRTLGEVNPAGYIRTDRKFSVTSSRHASSFAGLSSKIVDDATFCRLISPIETKR